MLASRKVETEDLSKVVWLLDPSYRPELEVEIEISYEADDLPGVHYASARAELEVELELTDGLEDLTSDCVTEDDFVVEIHAPALSPEGDPRQMVIAILTSRGPQSDRSASGPMITRS